jgi:hypothetical protein
MPNIIKASGETAAFDPSKLRRSLLKVGADTDLVEHIVENVTLSLREGMTTREIYRIAFRLLRTTSRTIAAKYHLKRAIMRLGTTGYPFEKYVAEILRSKGFLTQTNQIIQGRCVSHEVDVIAKDKQKNIYVECKYHNHQGKKCDVKIPLYVKARFLDIQETEKNSLAAHFEGWLVTNTRFTTDATQYGLCAGLNLIGWNYPLHGNLQEQIEISGLYPITCITDFTKADLFNLFSRNIVLCKSISDDPRILETLRISFNKRKSILNQCEKLSAIFNSNQKAV